MQDAGARAAARRAHHDGVEAALFGELGRKTERFAPRGRQDDRELAAGRKRGQSLGERTRRAIVVEAVGEPDDRARCGTAGERTFERAG